MQPSDNDIPWSIPIREADDDLPRHHATWLDRLPVTPVAVGAVLAFVGVVAAVILVGNEPATPTPSPEVLGEQVAVTETTIAQPPTTTTASTSTSISTSPTTTAPPADPGSVGSEDAGGPAPTPRDGEPEGLPIQGPGDVQSGWVAQVSSVPSSAGGSALARAYETVTATVPDAVILRGSEWAPLRDGFFVIVRTGFASAAEAVEGCDDSGRTGRDECFARFLSSIDDTQRTCWRDESGSLAGDCDP